MGKYQAYPEYKDSGVEWIGAIPKNWSFAPFKWQISRNDGGVWGSDPDGTDDTVVLRSTEQTMDGNWRVEDPAPRKLTVAERDFALLKEGDLVVTKSSGSSSHIGKTTLVNSDIEVMRCCYSNFMQRIRLKPTFLPKLAWYVMNSELARKQFDFLSNSTTGLANLNGTMLGQIYMALPTMAEQQKIAAFLDHETAKIDALIEKQQQLIQLLKEKRQAVISHAVTKGLNPNAPMKDSGIEWLGEVPAHWDVLSLKYSADVVDCKHITAEFVDEGFPVASIGEVKEWFVNLTTAKFTTEKFYRELIGGGRKPEPGDIIFSRNASVGEVALVPDEMPLFAMGQDVCLIRLMKNILPQFLMHILKSSVISQQLELAMVGSTFKRINVDGIRSFTVTSPPIDEQRKVVEYLDKHLSKYDLIIERAQSFVETMQERRTALISAAVTGKIDVRNFAEPATR